MTSCLLWTLTYLTVFMLLIKMHFIFNLLKMEIDYPTERFAGT